MPRRKSVPKRWLLPDPLFGSELVTKFINILMRDGKRSKAENIIYGASEHVLRQLQKDAALQAELLKKMQGKYSGTSGVGEDVGEGESGEGTESRGKSWRDAGEGSSKLDLTHFSKLSTVDIKTQPEARKIALAVIEKAIDQVRPVAEVRTRRVGGSNYQIPTEVPSSRRTTLAMRWLKTFASKRGDRSMTLSLGNELVDALMGRGGAVKKREEVHKMAEANRAFAHYKW